MLQSQARSGKQFSLPKMYVPSVKYLATFTFMAVQYARDISFIIPDSRHSKPREKFSFLCLKLAHILMDYVPTVLKNRAGLNSKSSALVTGYLKLVAHDSICESVLTLSSICLIRLSHLINQCLSACFFSRQQREDFKEAAKKMFSSIHQQAKPKSGASKSASNERNSKRGRRALRKNKSEQRSGIVPLHNGVDTVDSSEVSLLSMGDADSSGVASFSPLDSSGFRSATPTVEKTNGDDSASSSSDDGYYIAYSN